MAAPIVPRVASVGNARGADTATERRPIRAAVRPTHQFTHEAVMHPIRTPAAAPGATLTLLMLAMVAGACSDTSGPSQSPSARGPIAASLGKTSGSGARIVFASNRDVPSTEIYTVNPDGTGTTRLTFTAGATNTSPAWSPDRKRIAFMSTRTDPLGEIYVMNADGSYLTRLTYSAGADDAPAWSNDGKRIAFTSTRDG